MGDPRSERWCYGCRIECRSITIAINHTPLLAQFVRAQFSISALGAIRSPMVSRVGSSSLDA